MEHRVLNGTNTHVVVTAAIFILALTGAIAWEVWDRQPKATYYLAQGDHTQSGAATETAPTLSTDPVSNASTGALLELQGAVAGLQANGAYNVTSAAQLANQIGLSTRTNITYSGYALSDIRTDSDISAKRTQQYRIDLQSAARPLLKNTDFELSLLSNYLDTKDESYLEKMRSAAAQYLAAASSTARVVAPKDAATIHLGIINAMVEFGTVLNTMADHAQDPVATVMLINNYNQAESGMISSFNDLTSYFKHKLL